MKGVKEEGKNQKLTLTLRHGKSEEKREGEIYEKAGWPGSSCENRGTGGASGPSRKTFVLWGG